VCETMLIILRRTQTTLSKKSKHTKNQNGNRGPFELLCLELEELLLDLLLDLFPELLLEEQLQQEDHGQSTNSVNKQLRLQ